MQTALFARSHSKPMYGKTKEKGICLLGAQGQPNSFAILNIRDSSNVYDHETKDEQG